MVSCLKGEGESIQCRSPASNPFLADNKDVCFSLFLSFAPFQFVPLLNFGFMITSAIAGTDVFLTQLYG